MLHLRFFSLLASLALFMQVSAAQVFANVGDVTKSKDVTFSAVSPRDGSLWVATSGRGLLRLGATGRSFSYNSAKGDFSCDSILALAFDPDGNLWMKDAEGAVWAYSEVSGFSRRDNDVPGCVESSFVQATKPTGEVRTLSEAPDSTVKSAGSPGINIWLCLLLLAVAMVVGFVCGRFLLRRPSVASKGVFISEMDGIKDSGSIASVNPPAVRKSSGSATEPVSKATLKVGPELQTRDSEFYSKVLSIVMDRFRDPAFSVEDIASVFGITRVHLSRKLKAEGCPSPGELIKKTRMDAAAKMISSGETNMSHVAEYCGFSSPAYFSSAFKEYFGVPPRSYKS